MTLFTILPMVDSTLFGCGAGYANAQYSALTVIGGLPPATGAGTATGVFSDDRWGYEAGAGVEWGFAPNWSAKVEYMHYGFGTDTTAPLLFPSQVSQICASTSTPSKPGELSLQLGRSGRREVPVLP